MKSDTTENHSIAVSVVILTMNERSNIDRCMAALRFSDDIVIVDSGSTDGTVERAEALGARVIHRPFDHFAGQRNFALDTGSLKHEWVLHIDADEIVDAALRDAIGKACDTVDSALDAYRIPFKLMFGGHWLKHAGMYPSYQVRFGRRDGLRFKMVGHGQREDLPEERVGTLNGHLIHFNFSHGVTQWFMKHARYAHDEAILVNEGSAQTSLKHLFRIDSLARRRALKSLGSRMPFRPAVRFLYMYIVRRGFLDGRAGLHYCLMVATYQLMIDANLYEQRQQRKEQQAGGP